MMRKGQSFLEYALVLGCVAITLMTMQTYFKRGIQGVIKSTSDDMGSPVLEATGLNPQQEGGREKGYHYAAFPSTSATNQEFLVNEYARGDRRFEIVQDNTVSRQGSASSISFGQYLNYARTDEPAVVTTTAPVISGGYGGDGGFGGGGAAGLKETKAGGGGIIGAILSYFSGRFLTVNSVGRNGR